MANGIKLRQVRNDVVLLAEERQFLDLASQEVNLALKSGDRRPELTYEITIVSMIFRSDVIGNDKSSLGCSGFFDPVLLLLEFPLLLPIE